MTEYIAVRFLSEKEIDVDIPNVYVVSPSRLIEIARDESMEAIAAKIREPQGQEPIEIVVTIGENILYEAARLRAIRMYLEDLNHGHIFNILVRFNTAGQNELGDYDLIEKTYKVYAAILGCADMVLTDFADEEAVRLEINIHHILAHESGMKWVADPASGAFYIEKLTHEIFKKIKNSKK